MKPFVSILTLIAGFAAADEPESIVRFTNGDRLPGTMVSLGADQLVWSSPALVNPSSFFLKNVVDLTLPSSQPALNADHEAVLSLTNGDTVRGQLASVTDTTVSLDTWFAGRMDFNRLMVSDLKIEGKSNLLYRGPNGLEGWKQSADPPVWTFARGALRSNGKGGIARENVLPDECSISFDLAWKSDSLTFKVFIFSDNPSETDPNSGYEMSFQRNSVLLHNAHTSSFIDSAQSQILAENEKTRVEIRASRKSGKVCLFLDGRIIKVWMDPGFHAGKYGNALQFVSQDALPLKISGIEVGPWDGIVDRMPEPRMGMFRQFGQLRLNPTPDPGKKEPLKPGRMELANGDSLDGEVKSIDGGIITVNTSLGEVKLPVARLRTVALKKADLERCIRRKGDVRAWFPDGSSIVYRLDEVGDAVLKGSSQNFGTATFRLSAFNRIEFNIYPLDPSADRGRPAEEW